MTRRADTMRTLNPIRWIGISLACVTGLALGQTVEAVRVVSRPPNKTVELPGEFVPYLSVPIHAKISGFVEKVEVDRGSAVREGQLLATMIAPELRAQRAEARAKVSVAESQKTEAAARVLGA